MYAPMEWRPEGAPGERSVDDLVRQTPRSTRPVYIVAELTGTEQRTPVSPLGDELQIRRASPVPENYERIVELNRSGELPEGDPAELEAESYRCAAG
jgi:hypothetical protein